MTPPVQILTEREMRERRRELLIQSGMDELALRQAAADYRLSADSTALLDEIDRIDYLLGA